MPADLDLTAGVLRVRNNPRLGWQVKTRNQRDIPLVPALVDVLRAHLAGRTCGPVLRGRRWTDDGLGFDASSTAALKRELVRRLTNWDAAPGAPGRPARVRLAGCARGVGAGDENRVRIELIRAARSAGLVGQTAPKVLRHQFATALREGRVDPLVRNLLTGHAAADPRAPGHGLGMTAVYTHTRPETVREQLLAPFADRSALTLACEWASRNAVPFS